MRLVAYKLPISLVVNGKFNRSEDPMEPSYLTTEIGLDVSRVRILGTVIYKYVGENFNFIRVDDGTATIRVFAYEDPILDKVKVSDLVDVVGRIREREEEIYIAPEVVTILDDPNWETLRLLEHARFLRKYKGEKLSEETLDTEFEEWIMDDKDEILALIDIMDLGKGVKFEELMEELDISKEELGNLLKELEDDGWIKRENNRIKRLK
ncbi:MAG: OB-fold nucleic acid binding domain-containing protein [Candidatus Hydrothermarchaeota archaeon]